MDSRSFEYRADLVPCKAWVNLVNKTTNSKKKKQKRRKDCYCVRKKNISHKLQTAWLWEALGQTYTKISSDKANFLLTNIIFKEVLTSSKVYKKKAGNSFTQCLDNSNFFLSGDYSNFFYKLISSLFLLDGENSKRLCCLNYQNSYLLFINIKCIGQFIEHSTSHYMKHLETSHLSCTNLPLPLPISPLN